MEAPSAGSNHTVEYDPFIKSQLASTKLTLEPHVVYISSRPPQNLGVPKPSYSTEWIGQEGRCEATCKREFKLPWREAGPPNHYDDEVDSNQ